MSTPARPSGERPPRPLRAAYVDESVSGDGQLYTLTAAVVDTRHARDLVAGLHQRADLDVTTGRHYFHTVRAEEHRIAAMTAFLASAPGVHAVLTARAPVPARGQEQARQACLAELTAAVGAQGVVDMTMDGRRSLGRRPQALNNIDQATVAAARRAGLVPAAFRVRHIDDRDAPLVWIADVVGWQARRAIEYREPARLAPLAERLVMLEARVQLPEAPAVATSPQQAWERRGGRVARVHGPSPAPTNTGGRNPEGAPSAAGGSPVPASQVRRRASNGLQGHLDALASAAAQGGARATAARAARQGPVPASLADVVEELDRRAGLASRRAAAGAPLDSYVSNPRAERERRRSQQRPEQEPPRQGPRGPRPR